MRRPLELRRRDGTAPVRWLLAGLVVLALTAPSGPVQATLRAPAGPDRPPATAPNATPSAGATVTRLGGFDRFETAAIFAHATFAAPVATVYLADGLGFADGLAGAAAAATAGAPLLLTDPDALPSDTAAELGHLHPAHLVVLGSQASVSDAVARAAAALSGAAITRLAGTDRFATAAATSAATDPVGVATVVVADGLAFPDALAGAAAAGHLHGPLLLVTPTSIPPATALELVRLHPGGIIVLGSEASVGDAVLGALAAFTTGSVTRRAGADRYATAVALSTATYPSATTVYLADGLAFPDAL
ncbi:MAG: cell wall-binding repeat-containing protein, partial [Candidatus Limnocylindrales bacterium]